MSMQVVFYRILDAIPSASDMGALRVVQCRACLTECGDPVGEQRKSGISVCRTSQESTGVGWKQRWLCGHVMCSYRGPHVQKGPIVNLMLCHYLEILNHFKIRSPIFSFCTWCEDYAAGPEWMWEWFKTVITVM